MQLVRLKKPQLFSVLTIVYLTAFLLSAVSNARPLSCQNAFHENGDWLLSMNRQYKGEERGEYFDKETKQPWKTKYFTEAEKAPFRVYLKDGKYYNEHGQKMDSEYDPEGMHYDSSLLVIDKDFRIFVLPFEQRGLYHHSSLGAGDDVVFAGTVSFSNGSIFEISNSSGHYRPPSDHSLRVLKWIDDRGGLSDQTKVVGRMVEELKSAYSIKWKDLKTHP